LGVIVGVIVSGAMPRLANRLPKGSELRLNMHEGCVGLELFSKSEQKSRLADLGSETSDPGETLVGLKVFSNSKHKSRLTDLDTALTTTLSKASDGGETIVGLWDFSKDRPKSSRGDLGAAVLTRLSATSDTAEVLESSRVGELRLLDSSPLFERGVVDDVVIDKVRVTLLPRRG
jgi:hypothetical protein